MQQIGRYEIASELGRGAMGVVYRARDPRIGREVAIKTIKPADQADSGEIEDLRERLFREAQSAGRLSHPGIVTIFDVDEQDGLVYIAMELVEGQTLDRCAAAAGGGARSLDFAVDLLLQAGAALDYAHRRGIVHRDVKPSNIMISPDGVKIMDFGVARIASSQLTRTGAVMGTPNYMSPEQVKGEEIDGRSDQFSLGAIGYELLTGKKPFQASSLTSTIFKIVSADPLRPRQWNPQISLLLDEAVMRALAKNPDERFAACREFAEAAAAAAEQMRAGGESLVLPAAGVGGGETPTADPTQPGAAPGGDAADETAADIGAAAAAAGPSKPVEAAPILPAPARKKRAAAAVPPPAGPAPAAAAQKSSRWPLAVLLLLVAASGGLAFFLYNNPALLDNPERLLQVILGPAPDAVRETPRAADEPAAPAAPADPVEPLADPEPPVGTSETSAEAPAAPAKPPVETAAAPAAPLPAEAPVTFVSSEDGARIAVDRRPEWTCTAPCEPMRLPPGGHTARAALDGYRPQQKSFDVGAEPLEIAFALQPLRAVLLISSQPQGGDIHIDGRDTGQKTPAKAEVAPGRRVVRVVKGALFAEQTVEALPETTYALRFDLDGR